MAAENLNGLRNVLTKTGSNTRIMKVVDVNAGIITAMVGNETAFFKSDLDILGSDNIIVDEGGIIGTAGRNIPQVFV